MKKVLILLLAVGSASSYAQNNKSCTLHITEVAKEVAFANCYQVGKRQNRTRCDFDEGRFNAFKESLSRKNVTLTKDYKTADFGIKYTSGVTGSTRKTDVYGNIIGETYHVGYFLDLYSRSAYIPSIAEEQVDSESVEELLEFIDCN